MKRLLRWPSIVAVSWFGGYGEQIKYSTAPMGAPSQRYHHVGNGVYVFEPKLIDAA